MGRSPCCDESGLKKGPWTPEEDDKLIIFIQKHGHGSWRALPKLAGLNRCGKSCRLRWTNYLRPDIKRGKFSQDEERTILNLHSILGNKWSAIATHLPGRTDNEIKNFWNTHLKKKLIQMGFDPMTHRPRTDIFTSLPHLIALANLIENPSWEDQAMRLQAEAVQMARLNHCLQTLLQTNNTSIPDISITNFNLLSSLKDTSILNHLEMTSPPAMAAAFGDGFFQDSMINNFSHLPDLRAVNQSASSSSSLSKGGMVDQGSDFGLGFNWSNLSPSPPSATAGTATETSGGTNTVEACSASSYGGAQMWSELLDDPIFHDNIALSI